MTFTLIVNSIQQTDGGLDVNTNLGELVPLNTVSKRTSLPDHTLRRGLNDGRIRGQKIGRDWFVFNDEADRLAKEFPIEGIR